MSEKTKIEWCDSTLNPWIGCTRVSPGCDHCYAEAQMDTRMGRVKWGAGQARSRTSAAYWKQPLRWNAAEFRECCGCGHRGDAGEWSRVDPFGCPICGSIAWKAARRRVFCASLADWLDNEAPIEWLVDLLDLIRRTPNIDWLLLTKRIGNWSKRISEAIGFLDEHTHAAYLLQLRQWLADWLDGDHNPDNVWLGATICNQAEADRDIPKLLATPAAKRFLSIEPMLGPVDLRWLITEPTGNFRTHGGRRQMELRSTGLLHWVICGGESGQHARAMHPDWVRSLRDQCAAANVPFLFKQWGSWQNGSALNKRDAMVLNDGRVLFDRTMPAVKAADREKPVMRHNPTIMAEVGKKAAGRTIDDREHTEFPA